MHLYSSLETILPKLKGSPTLTCHYYPTYLIPSLITVRVDSIFSYQIPHYNISIVSSQFHHYREPSSQEKPPQENTDMCITKINIKTEGNVPKTLSHPWKNIKGSKVITRFYALDTHKRVFDYQLL